MIRILTEAGRKVGLGHLTRMRSLKEQLIEDGYPACIIVHIEEEDRDLIGRSGQNETLRRWINDFDALCADYCKDDIAVVDTYRTTKEFMKRVSCSFSKLVAIDDYNRIQYENCVVVNPNYYGSYIDYPSDNNCEYYLGSDYTLVRPAFRVLGKRLIRESVQRILITFGGTDVMGLTARAIEYCHALDPSAGLDVVATNAFSGIGEIKALIRKGDLLHFSVDAEKMNELMNGADFAIASAGSTSNELFKTQCPSILIKVAENQAETIRYLEPRGYFKTFDINSFDRIGEMFDSKVRKSIHGKLLELETSSTAKDLIERIYDENTISENRQLKR